MSSGLLYPVPDCQPAQPYFPYPQHTRGFGNRVHAHPSNNWHIHPKRPYNVAAMAQMNPTEMEEFQNLSDRYAAELPGPLIGAKQPVSALTTEYAEADPTYVVKTAALAATHTGYRAIKGDGQCGWRSAVFGYFETLLQLGDIQMVQQETVRLRSFEETMKIAGIDYDIMVDMFDYTWELLEDVRRAVERQEKNDGIILNILNDENKSNSIVYHFKMITSAYMQLRYDQYEPFLEMTIYEYRVARIDPANQEIDQIGLQALNDGVIAPAGFALEVLYLDRSLGDEVTPHQFSPDLLGGPTIRLLYRPGHYDMIYREAQPPMQVFLQTHNLVPQGMEMAYNPDSSTDLQAYLFPDTAFQSSAHQSNQPSHLSQDSPSYDRRGYFKPNDQLYYMPADAYPVQMPSSALTPEYYPAPSPQNPSPRSVTISPSPHATTPSSSVSAKANVTGTNMSMSMSGEPQIRLNANCFNMRRHESVPLDCGNQSTAALSQAHFRNQDFQPYMWNATEGYLAKP